MGLADRHRDRGSTETNRRDDPEVVHDVRDDRDRHDATSPNFVPPGEARRRDPADDRDREYRRPTEDRTDRDRTTRDRGHDAPVAVEARRSTAAAIALTLGIIAVVLAIVPIAGIIGSAIGVIAVITGIIGMFAARKATVTGGGMALAGLVLGILSVVLGAAGLVLFSDTAADLQQPVEDAVSDVQEQVEDATTD
jgi:hypothetical protein